MIAIVFVLCLLGITAGNPLYSAGEGSIASATPLQSEVPVGGGDAKQSEYKNVLPASKIESSITNKGSEPEADSSLCSSFSSYLPSSLSSSLCPPPAPVEDKSPPKVVEPLSIKEVVYAFLPNPSPTNVFVFLVTVLVIFSPKARKSMITYGGVATLCIWYAGRRVVNRKEEQMNRRMSIKLNRTPSPLKRPKSPGLETVSEEGGAGNGSKKKGKKKPSPWKKLFKAE